MRRHLLYILVILSLPRLCLAADNTSHWQFGMGLGGISIPHYRGSNQRETYLAPIPYVRYEGQRLKVDREGGRFYLYRGNTVWLDLSASFGLPVNSRDDRARQGMPNLKPVFEVGPRIQIDLDKTPSWLVRIALPVRMAIATDIRHSQNIGYVFSPYLQIRYFTRWDSALSLGPIFASESYHDYYYQVDPQYATPTRPAYDAKAGYSGFRFTLSSSRRFDRRYWLGLFMRYDKLDGAVFVDSPLVKQKDSLMFGLAFAWIFSRSSQDNH